MGFSVVEGGHLGADHPGPGEVDHPGAESRSQLGEPLQLPSQLQQERRRPPGETESGADLVGGELPVVVSNQTAGLGGGVGHPGHRGQQPGLVIGHLAGWAPITTTRSKPGRESRSIPANTRASSGPGGISSRPSGSTDGGGGGHKPETASPANMTTPWFTVGK